MDVKCYSELILLPTFEERYRYLRLSGQVGVETFGYDRYLNQLFYTSDKWRRIRDKVIMRDNGCDLGIEGYDIRRKLVVHHMNTITVSDIEHESDFLIDPEFLITTTHNTHLAIHYGDESLLMKGPVERTMFDTCPWKQFAK